MSDNATRAKRLFSSEQAALDFQSVANTPEGQRMLWRLITGCGVWDTITLTPNWMQWQEGRRSVGVELMQELDRVDRGLVPRMMQANANAEIVHDTERKRSR